MQIPTYTAAEYETPVQLVYRTGKISFIRPTGFDTYRELKSPRGVFIHKINNNWVLWSSIDVVRFRVGGPQYSTGEEMVLGPVASFLIPFLSPWPPNCLNF